MKNLERYARAGRRFQWGGEMKIFKKCIRFVLGLSLLVFYAKAVYGGPYAYAVNSRISQVGVLDRDLSKLCRLNLFNQKKKLTKYIFYYKNKALTGIATKEWNLRDKRGKAQDQITYHFYNDGWSNCLVYRAPN